MNNGFLEYYHREDKKRAVTEEEQLALHKKQKVIESKRHQLEEEDDFYNEDVDINEARRVNVPTRPLPPKRPIAPPAPKPVVRPAPAPTAVPTKVRSRASSQMDEAFEMIDKLTDKITSMFFKYGFAGLEKISRHLNEDIEDIINPQPVYRDEPNESYSIDEERMERLEKENARLRRLLEKSLEQRQVIHEEPVHKAQKIEETTIDEEHDDVPTEELDEGFDDTYGMPDEADNKKLNEKFISMNENMDINALGASLSQQAVMQKRKEMTENNTLAQVTARAQMLQKSMDKQIDDKIMSQEQQIDESFEQSEELEVVDVEEPTQPVENVKSTPAAKSTKKVSKKKKSDKK